MNLDGFYHYSFLNIGHVDLEFINGVLQFSFSLTQGSESYNRNKLRLVHFEFFKMAATCKIDCTYLNLSFPYRHVILLSYR